MKINLKKNNLPVFLRLTIHKKMQKQFFFVSSITIIVLMTVAQNQYAQTTDTAKTAKTADPYLWLEEVEGANALKWVRNENERSKAVLTKAAIYEPVKQKILNILDDDEKIAYPSIVGDYVYNLWRDAKNERGLWRRMNYDDYVAGKTAWETVLDIDQLSEKEGKKWVYSGATWLKPDNNKCLLSLSDGGTDENEVREFDAVTKSFVKDGFYFESSKGGIGWVDENTVLVYRDFGAGSLTQSGYPRLVKILKRGQSLAEAKQVFETDTTSVGAFGNTFYSNGKLHQIIYDSQTFYTRDIYYFLAGKFQKFNIPSDANFESYFKDEVVIALQSNWELNGEVFKQGALVSINIEENLKGTIKPQLIYEPNKKTSISSVSSTKDYLVVNVLENVKNKLLKYKLANGKWEQQEVKSLELGSIYLRSSTDEANHIFLTYSNFITPTTLYLYNTELNEFKIVDKQKENFDATGLIVNQYFANSKDGTKVPYFIVHQQNIQFNNANPVMIDAYGGFNVSLQPNYNSLIGAGWLAQGGVYVLANIRGGGEFGPSWHQAAKKEKRQNAYNDAIAVAEDLINRKITSPKHLGIYGWSNGGLLTGVLFTQRPDLYKAVVVGAPLLDMKRFSKLLAGASWMGEYGDPNIPEEWAYIKEYSPYHNLKKETKYPEVFFVTSTKDDRVHPGHARKMAAKMKYNGYPFLYHETIEGGHGGASTNEQVADKWASIFTYFNMKLMVKK